MTQYALGVIVGRGVRDCNLTIDLEPPRDKPIVFAGYRARSVFAPFDTVHAEGQWRSRGSGCRRF